MKQRIQRIILMIASSIFIALMTGKEVLVPMHGYIPETLYEFILGIGFVETLLFIENIALALIIRIDLKQDRREEFPQNVETVRAMGVSTPIDFSYMMVNLLKDVRPSLIGSCDVKYSNEVRTIYDIELIRRGDELYEEMFKCKPSEDRITDWEYMAKYELEEKLGERLGFLSMKELSEYVSPKIKEYFKAT